MKTCRYLEDRSYDEYMLWYGAWEHTRPPTDRHIRGAHSNPCILLVWLIHSMRAVVKRAFEQRIDRLVRARLYDEARRRRQALEVINEAFHDLQRKERRR